MADPIPFYAAPIPTGEEMPPGAIPVRVYGLDASGGAPPAETITGTTYTVQSDDGGELKVCTAATAITVTVPANTVIVPAGRVVRVDFLAAGGGAITFAAGSGMTLDGTPSLVTRGTPSAASLLLLSATSAVVVGDLATP